MCHPLPEHVPGREPHKPLSSGACSRHGVSQHGSPLTCNNLMTLQSLHHRGHIALPEVAVTQLPLLRSQGH